MNLPSLNLSKVHSAQQPPIYGKYGQHSARTNRNQIYGAPKSHRGIGMYKIPQSRHIPYGFAGNNQLGGQQQTSFAGPSNFSFTSNHKHRRRHRKEQHRHQAYAQHISPKRKHHHKPIVDNKKSNPYRNRAYKGDKVESNVGGVVPKLNVGESWAKSRGGKQHRHHAGSGQPPHYGSQYASGSKTARNASGGDKLSISVEEEWRSNAVSHIEERSQEVRV